MNVKELIKEYLSKENETLTNVINKINLNKTDDEKTTVQNINNKLTRETIKYTEILEIADVLGYDIVWKKRNHIPVQSSKNLITSTNVGTGIAIGTTLGGVGGGLLGAISTAVLKQSLRKSSKSNDKKDKATEELEKAIKAQQDRLNFEYEVEKNLETIIRGILLKDTTPKDESYRLELDNTLKSAKYPTSMKFQMSYKIIYNILSTQYYNDDMLLPFIVEIKNMYSHGDLMDLDLKTLEEFNEACKYIINKYFKNID